MLMLLHLHQYLTCNLDLNGGLLTKFTASTNAVWNGETIGTIYGGTGLTIYKRTNIIFFWNNTLAKLNIVLTSF